MKKKIGWLVVILILGGLGYLAYHFVSPYKKMDLLQAIPAQPVFIIEMDNSYASWQKITKGAIWSNVKKHQFFARMASGMDMLDSVISGNEKLAKFVGTRSLVVSMHLVQGNDYDFVYITDIRRVSKLLPVKDALNGILSAKFKMHIYSYKGITIYQVQNASSKSVLNIGIVNNLLIASYNQRLMEMSISRANDRDFQVDEHYLTLHDKLKGDGILRFYINYAELDNYTNGLLSSPDQNIRQLSKSLFYTGLALNIDEDNMIRCDGYTNFNDTVTSSLRAMMLSGSGKTGLADVLPLNTASSVSLGFDRFTEYFDNLMINLKEVPKSYADYQSTMKQAESYLKIDIRKNLMSWIDDEAAMVHLPPMGLGRNNEFAVFLKTRSIADARKNLDFVAERIRKRTPAKFEKIEYEGYEIHYLAMKGFFRLLFGKYFQKLEKPYFTYVGDYVVFSNHPQTLKVIIDGVVRNNLITNLPGCKSFTGNFSRHSNVFMLVNTTSFTESLQGSVNASTWADLQKNKSYTMRFPFLGFQLEKDGSLFKTKLYIQYKSETPEEDKIALTDTTENSSPDTISLPESAENQAIVLALLNQVDTYVPDDVNAKKYSEKFSNGKTKMTMELKDGFRHGDYLEYYENGNYKIQGYFKKDHREGTWKIFDESGKLLQKIKYDHGKTKQ